MPGHGSDPTVIPPRFVSPGGGAPLHPGPGLREIRGENSVARKQLEPLSHDGQVQEADIEERAHELVVLLAPCGELGGRKVVALETPPTPVTGPLGGEGDEPFLPARRRDRGPKSTPSAK